MPLQGTYTSLSISNGWFQITHRYGQHDLQTVTVSAPLNAMRGSSEGYWVIYIHGGAWRDPAITSASFERTQSLLRGSSPSPSAHYASTTLPHIAGFASIEYRLSPHPNFPQDRAGTDANRLRDARHPDHIHDVRDALALLQSRYGVVGRRCVLVGHSCGATLAFQSVMRDLAGAARHESSTGLIQPTAIVGVEGIYDLRLLRDTYRHCSVYQDFIEGAFGPDEDLWDAVSPATKKDPDGVGIEASWSEGTLAVLAHSRDDELVDFGQVSAMKATLEQWAENQKKNEKNARVLVLDDLRGTHDEVWSKGEELARVIAVVIEELRKMDADP